VLIISAMDKEDPQQYADANAFVLKPVRPDVLLEHVRRLVNRAHSQPREEAEA
jgi:DNA-binding response OmpR family regulator